MNKVILSIIIFFFYGLSPVLAAKGGKIIQPVEWQNPLPKIAELGIDFREVENIIGDNGQFIFARDPIEITCWTKKGEKTYPEEPIVTVLKIVHVPVAKAREVIRDYSLINKIQPQHTNVAFVSKKDNHILYSYDQTYKISFITLDANFILQQTLEKDGSIGILLHKGDVESQIRRYEFIPLDENKTIIALTSWIALSTAQFTYKVMMSVMPESHLCFSVGMASMYLEQFANYINKDWLTERNYKLSKKSIDTKIDIPLYTKKLSTKNRQLIESLVPGGFVCLRTLQSAKVHGEEMRDLMFFTMFDNIDVPYEHAAPILSDFHTWPESNPSITSINTKKIPEGTWVRIKYNFGKFPIIMPLSTYHVFCFPEENIMIFSNPGIKGAYSPYSAVYEWSPMNNNKNATFYILSHTCRVGPEANLFMRTFNKLIPDAENVQLITGGIIAVESRKKYIEKKYSASVN